jgi:hypothetical protein
VFQLRKGFDPAKGVTWLLNRIKNLFTPQPKVKMSYRKPVNDFEYNKLKNQEQERMNEILEKISKSGYGSLSKEEKEILFRMGK